MSENISNKNIRNQVETENEMINLMGNINRDDDLKMNRRGFIKTAFAASAVLGLATTPIPYLTAMAEKNKENKKVKICSVDQLEKGSFISFDYPDKADTAILIHTLSGELIAYNSKCTHLQCPVFYRVEEEKEEIFCPCHKGYFDLTGHPVAGPPQRELPKILVEIENGEVFAVGREVRHG